MNHPASPSLSALPPWLAAVGDARAFAALADLWPDAAVFAVDGERNVVFWSEGAERLLGFSAKDTVGQHCLKGSRCPECMAGCGLTDMGGVKGAHLTLYRKDGRQVSVTKHARAFFDERGRFLGGLEVLVPDEGELEPRRSLPLLDERAEPSGRSAGNVFHGIISRDPAMQQLFATLRNVAKTDATVLVRGESGAGKELLAQAIHEESHRKDGPFLAVNCAAMTPSLLESELFGHEKGAFTGALQTHQGVFERAHEGTLFLDEVAELPLELQAKLLRVLEERTFFRVGGQKPITASVRIVSATHRSLREEVQQGRFREDLMYRLRVVPLFLPPLRERRGDISLLVDHFIRLLNERGLRQVREVGPDALRALLDYGWPGNVRELRNVVEYAFAVGRGPVLGLMDLPPEVARQDPPRPGKAERPRERRADDEQERIRRALADAGGNIGKAAEQLGVSRPTLWRKRKKYGL